MTATTSENVSKIRVKWIKSISGAKKFHRGTIRALGLKRMNHEVVHNATPQIRGMVHSVRHLVEVTEVED